MGNVNNSPLDINNVDVLNEALQYVKESSIPDWYAAFPDRLNSDVLQERAMQYYQTLSVDKLFELYDLYERRKHVENDARMELIADVLRDEEYLVLILDTFPIRNGGYLRLDEYNAHKNNLRRLNLMMRLAPVLTPHATTLQIDKLRNDSFNSPDPIREIPEHFRNILDITRLAPVLFQRDYTPDYKTAYLTHFKYVVYRYPDLFRRRVEADGAVRIWGTVVSPERTPAGEDVHYECTESEDITFPLEPPITVRLTVERRRVYSYYNSRYVNPQNRLHSLLIRFMYRVPP